MSDAKPIGVVLADAAYEFVELVMKAASSDGEPSGFDRVSAIIMAAERSPAEAVLRFQSAGILSGRYDEAAIRGLATLAVEAAAGILIGLTERPSHE